MPFVVSSSNFSEPGNEEPPTSCYPRGVKGRLVPRKHRRVSDGLGKSRAAGETKAKGESPAVGRRSGPGVSPRNSVVSVRALLKTLLARNEECKYLRRWPPAAGSRHCCTLTATSGRIFRPSGEEGGSESLARFPATARRHPATFGRFELRVSPRRGRKAQPPALRRAVSRRAGLGSGSAPQARSGTRPAPSPRRGASQDPSSSAPARSGVGPFGRQQLSAPSSPDAPSAPG